MCTHCNILDITVETEYLNSDNDNRGTGVIDTVGRVPSDHREGQLAAQRPYSSRNSSKGPIVVSNSCILMAQDTVVHCGGGYGVDRLMVSTVFMVSNDIY